MEKGRLAPEEEAKACESGSSRDRRALYVGVSKKLVVGVWGRGQEREEGVGFLVGGRGESTGR